MAGFTLVSESTVRESADYRWWNWVGYRKRERADVYFEVVEEYRREGQRVIGRCRYPNDARAWKGDLSQ